MSVSGYLVPLPGSTAMMGDIPVVILAVMIRRSSTVQIEVSWVSSGDRKTAWVEEFEITGTTKSTELVTVGFKPE